jgi:hypothetical protein
MTACARWLAACPCPTVHWRLCIQAMTRTATWTLLLMGIALLVTLHLQDPADAGLYPACPSNALSGYACPGCGSLRATHHLLHGRLNAAWGYNALLVLALPLFLLQWGLWRVRRRPGAQLFPRPILVLWVLAIVAWGIIRNL